MIQIGMNKKNGSILTGSASITANGDEHNQTIKTGKNGGIAHSCSSSANTEEAKEEIKVSGATTR